jgi:hypothetical protein
MKGTKDCWNLACICWIDEPDTSNCMTEDIEPQDCGLADLDMRSIINIIDIKIKNRLKKVTPDDNVPDTASFLYMHDNHTFTKLAGCSLDEIIAHCNQVREKSPYGMLCPVILLKGDREIRRVGDGVNCNGLKETKTWLFDIRRWESQISHDDDVMRILVSDRFKHEGRR